MSTQLSTQNGDRRSQRKADAAGTHQNQYNVQARHRARFVADLSSAQRDRKRKNDRDAQRVHRQRTKEHIEKLEQRVQELESLLAAKNAADNNNVGSGMPMDLDQNMGADTTNTKRQVYTDNNMVGPFGNETSTGDIHNIGEEGGYGYGPFSNHTTQQPWGPLASGNLYTTYLENSFHEELSMVGQPLKYRRLMRKNETHVAKICTARGATKRDIAKSNFEK
ncbi:hypothetical protein VE01_09457 [Pseudogymnoascus verrucosus]|uniref:BZIP domain-containing protein n=1 Tax=Pseudogymnoascus verrucosus TaxID=342668 RepID=A0A1B8G9M8_9PEZI|nr:uncharacterized protein VE01_09457 [Pseudogymnoascus verrucosus]OBT92521.1 hypothetical protein VE01_09457 [Pseudogymnoascus verrucosus]